MESAESPQEVEEGEEVLLSIEEARDVARKLLKEKKFLEACNLFDDLVSRVVGQKTESSLECALAMFDCGSAYLEYACHKNEQMVMEQLATTIQGIKPPPSKPKEAEEDDDDDEDDEKDEEGPEEISEDPMEVAWNMLEQSRVSLVRLIERKSDYSSEGDEIKCTLSELQQYLADTHMRLGDLSLEQSQFDVAVEDFSKALELRRSVLPSHHRSICGSLTMIAQTYVHAEKDAEALTSYEFAKQVCEEGLAHAHETIPDDTETIEELQGFIAEFAEKINQLQRKSAPPASTPSGGNIGQSQLANKPKQPTHLGVFGGKRKKRGAEEGKGEDKIATPPAKKKKIENGES